MTTKYFVYYDDFKGFNILTESQSASSSYDDFQYHDFYEIYLLHSGLRTHIIGNTFFNVKERDILLIPPYTLHRNHSGSDHRRTVIYFSKSFLNKYYTNSLIDIIDNLFNATTNTTLTEHEYTHLCSFISQLSNDSDDKSIALTLPTVIHIIRKAALRTNNTRSANTDTEDNFTHILKYINDNYLDINALDDIAAHFYISKSYLCRIFKKNTNITISNYINIKKTALACDMLKNTAKPITQIGFECGYNSSMYFCKTFKSIKHCTPLEYRNQI